MVLMSLSSFWPIAKNIILRILVSNGYLRANLASATSTGPKLAIFGEYLNLQKPMTQQIVVTRAGKYGKFGKFGEFCEFGEGRLDCYIPKMIFFVHKMTYLKNLPD